MPFVPGGSLEGHLLLGRDPLRHRGVRAVLRPVRPRRASPIRRSSRRRPSPTSSSSGSTRCCRSCRRRWRRRSCSSGRRSASSVLLALPFVSGEGEKSWKRRPDRRADHRPRRGGAGRRSPSSATHTPWSPVMDAWSGAADPGRVSRRTARRSSARARSSSRPSSATTATRSAAPAAQRGPALDAVAVRLTQDQLIRQVIQGGGNMPAYGKNLSPAETTALVAFLETLHPPGQPPAATPRGRRSWSRARDLALGGRAGGRARRARRRLSARRAPHALGARITAFLARPRHALARRRVPARAPRSGRTSRPHMIQHLLIMTVAAPLLLLGEPAPRLPRPRARRWSAASGARAGSPARSSCSSGTCRRCSSSGCAGTRSSTRRSSPAGCSSGCR